MPEPHILLFELASGGHQGHYLHQLISFWGRHRLQGRLTVAVPERVLDVHPEVPASITEYGASGVALLPIKEAAPARPAGPFGLLRKGLQEGRLLKKYIDQARPDHAVAMYFDHVQVALALGLRFSAPVHLSALYFRPSFHYGDLGPARRTAKERLLDARERAVLAGALANPHLHTLFCLDPFVAPYIRRLQRSARAVTLPDGIDARVPKTNRDETRRSLGIEPGRKMLLLFGVLDHRKGLPGLLEALAVLPEESCRNACVVLAGPLDAALKDTALERIDRLRRTRPLQILLQDRFISDDEAQALMQATDLALLPYDRHIGSSAVLVRAAHAGVPVIGQDYGLMGALIRHYRLGRTVDTAHPEALADALHGFLSAPDRFSFDPEGARRYAEANTGEAMAATIFRHLGVPGLPVHLAQPISPLILQPENRAA